jgi:hypothetical protein
LQVDSHPHDHRQREGFATTIEANPWKRATPEEWAHVLGQALLHIYFCHADPERSDDAWCVACEVVAEEFLRALEVGRRPEELRPADLPSLGRDVEAVASALREGGSALLGLYGGAGLAAGAPSFTFTSGLPPLPAKVRRERQEILAAAIRASVVKAAARPPAAGGVSVPGPFGIDRRHRSAGGPDRQHRLPEALAPWSRSGKSVS